MPDSSLMPDSPEVAKPAPGRKHRQWPLWYQGRTDRPSWPWPRTWAVWGRYTSREAAGQAMDRVARNYTACEFVVTEPGGRP